MALRDTARNVVEAIIPPSTAQLRERLEAARLELVTAQQADREAQAALDGAYGNPDDKLVLKAESDRAQSKLKLERAAGRVSALDGQVTTAEAADADAALSAGRRTLSHHIEARGELGVQILNALDQLEGAIKAFGVNESAILALPLKVRGSSAVAGFNLGAGALQAHVGVELRQRGIDGQPSSLAVTRLADWLSLGSRTLGS